MQAEQSWSPTPQPIQSTVATPTALPVGGAIVSGTLVTLNATSGATIYYTIDGSTPYTEPINITNSTTIKAFAVQPGRKNSSVARFEYTVTIPIELPESIESTSQLVVGQAYTGSVAASGGAGAITYEVTSGQLPAELDLDENTGVISGTPSASGTYSFTISTTDSATTPATASVQYIITIAPPAPILTHLTSNLANVMLTASRQLESIYASLASYGLRVGATTNLTVNAYFDDAAVEVTARATIEIENPELATIDANGIITVLKPGNLIIKVTFLSLEYIIDVTIQE